MSRSALVILSGGQDSTTCLYWAREHFGVVGALTFDYGQRHRVEIEAARRIAKLANVAHEVVEIGPLLKSRSPLTEQGEALETYRDYTSMDAIIGKRVELTFVPMRNALFLTLAANRAVAMDCFNVVIGVCESDNANYPDCTSGFIAAQEQAINAALGIDRFEIHAPLLYSTKAESIALAQTLPGCMEALKYSHTCYAGRVPPCGVCHACVLRAHGFKEAGVVDPLLAPE